MQLYGHQSVDSYPLPPPPDSLSVFFFFVFFHPLSSSPGSLLGELAVSSLCFSCRRNKQKTVVNLGHFTNIESSAFFFLQRHFGDFK